MTYEEEMTDKMSKEEKKIFGDWETKCKAEGDARCLQEYQKIQADTKRKKMAVACLKYKLKEAQKAVDDAE